MRYLLFISVYTFVFLSCKESPKADTSLAVPGLLDTVEVIRDSVGINHIYAQNQHDLFFAQGYCAAKDRLFQFEVWRRQATGTTAELLGARALERDIGTRLFAFRGDMQTEMAHYHPDGIEILTAYTEGVNAYIEEALQHPDALPLPFKALGITPQKWTPDVIISRHQGLLGNIKDELAIGRAVAALGPDKVKQYLWFHPKEPNLALDPSITSELLEKDILAPYNAYRQPLTFLPRDILPHYRAKETMAHLPTNAGGKDDIFLGSNNWVTQPQLSKNGHTYMANDPHRRLAIPSLRYYVHLSAPGWNVIGGGEPVIPGVSIGHNDHGAWGLTVYRTDGEDLYVYDLNPENHNQYRYQDSWEDMELITETIAVKDSTDVEVTLRYTRHGPVTYIDTENHKAYAVRCAWMEPGGSPYLASLRMDQAKNWEEFREACHYSHIPGENMIWADTQGNIGWQSVGIAPIRPTFSGLVPVPGDGRYEWDGYLPIKDKPHAYNPAKGYIATANQNVTPDTYDRWDAIGFSWADPFRGMRIDEVLGADTPLDMEAMKRLQNDYFSVPARTLVPYLTPLVTEDPILTKAKEMVLDWDYQLEKTSVAAGIYVAWENELKIRLLEYFPDPGAEVLVKKMQLGKLLQWIQNPEERFGPDGKAQVERYLLGCFASAVDGLQERFGTDYTTWIYGQPNYKHVQITHPLGKVVGATWATQLNTELHPRGGNQYTPGSTGSNEGQTSGASFRIIVDVNDWDQSIGANPPGQSGDPNSPFYKNLYDSWLQDRYVPIYFSKEKVTAAAFDKTHLAPR